VSGRRRILHLGLGAFHRAHQAACQQRLLDAGRADWELVGGNIRPDPAGIEPALVAQRGAYTLETVAPDGRRRHQLVRAIADVVPYAPGLEALVRIGADPATRIVSFTVTEAGYYLDAQWQLDPSRADVRAELDARREGRIAGTIYGALAAILGARRRLGGGPLTLLSCDNLRHNGERLRRGLLDFLQLAGEADLRGWVDVHTTCPNAMVDRITPRPPADLRARVLEATGRDDAVPVMAEEFLQWVIEDDFRGGRPPWEDVGVTVVDSVAPYEEAKIRILNGSHSAIAWAGALRGYGTIHEALADQDIRRLAHDYVSDDVLPCLEPGPIDLRAYRDQVLARFGNAALGDSIQRVAMDGYSKLTGFIVPTIREGLAAGRSIASVAMVPALLLAFLRRWHEARLAFDLVDSAMDPASAHALFQSPDPVRAFCADPVLWGTLAGDARVEAAVRTASARVETFASRNSAGLE